MTWEELSEKPETFQLSESAERINDLVVSIFASTADGKELLRLLLEKYLYAQVCPFNQAASFGYYREGQNSIILGLKKIVDNHKVNHKSGAKK